jgi:hypothetical protein
LRRGPIGQRESVELETSLIIQMQRIREQTHRHRTRASHPTSLKISNGADADPSLVRKRLLRQHKPLPMTTQRHAERCDHHRPACSPTWPTEGDLVGLLSFIDRFLRPGEFAWH